MKQFIASRNFEYHGDTYEIGDIVEVEDHVADKLCNRGYGSQEIENRKQDVEVDVDRRQPKKKGKRKKKKKE